MIFEVLNYGFKVHTKTMIVYFIGELAKICRPLDSTMIAKKILLLLIHYISQFKWEGEHRVLSVPVPLINLIVPLILEDKKSISFSQVPLSHSFWRTKSPFPSHKWPCCTHFGGPKVHFLLTSDLVALILEDQKSISFSQVTLSLSF